MIFRNVNVVTFDEIHEEATRIGYNYNHAADLLNKELFRFIEPYKLLEKGCFGGYDVPTDVIKIVDSFLDRHELVQCYLIFSK